MFKTEKNGNKITVEKSINIILCIVLFLLPLITIPRKLTTYYNIPKYILLLSCGLVLLVCLIIKIKRKELKLDLIDKTLFAFYILIVISTIFSMDVIKSIIGERNRFEGLLTFTIYFMIYYCAKYYFSYNKYLKRFAIATILITSIIGILQYYNICPIYSLFNIPNYPSVALSTFGHRNFFGSFQAIVVPTCIALYITKRKKTYLFLSLISFWALLASMARSSWVGLAVACLLGLIFIFKNFKKRIVPSLHILIGCIIIFVFVLTPPQFVKNMINPNDNFYSLEGRIDSLKNEVTNISNSQDAKKTEKAVWNAGTGRVGIWLATLQSIAKEPILGTGPDTLQDALLHNSTEFFLFRLYTFWETVDKAHNEYLQIAATIGIPALMIYLAFLAQIIFGQKKAFKNDNTFIFLIPIISYLAQAFFNISTIRNSTNILVFAWNNTK